MLSHSWSRQLLTGLVLSLGISQFTRAANFDVQVGQSGLTYTPDHLDNVAAQDTVTFHFGSQVSHSATQGDASSPCTPLSGGFDSGLLPSGSTNTYQVTVNSTDPIWVFCKVPGHCAAGMVFVVNSSASSISGTASASGSSTAGSSASGSSPTSTPSGSSTPSSGSSSTTTSRNGALTKHVANGFGIAAFVAVVGAMVL